MNILIVGAGAIGMLFGGYLSKDNQITLIARRKDQADAICSKGCLFIATNNEEVMYYPQVIQWDSWKDNHIDYDVALITTKQNHLPDLLPQLEKFITKDIPLLFLLNGLGHPELIKKTLSHTSIYTGITQSGATKRSDWIVEEKGRSVTKVGFIPEYPVIGIKGVQKKRLWPQALITLKKQFSIRHLDLILKEDIEIDMLKKCIVNACINPLTALFEVPNGELITNDKLHQIMGRLFLEIKQLLQQAAPELLKRLYIEGDLWEEIIKICRITSTNLSSMLQDVQNQRQTEIDAITGYFLQLAAKHNKQMPYHQFLFDSIRFKEDQSTTSNRSDNKI